MIAFLRCLYLELKPLPVVFYFHNSFPTQKFLLRAGHVNGVLVTVTLFFSNIHTFVLVTTTSMQFFLQSRYGRQ